LPAVRRHPDGDVMANQLRAGCSRSQGTYLDNASSIIRIEFL